MRRLTVLAGLLGFLLVLSLILLREVFGTIFFAITVAYVLFPVQKRLVRRNIDTRIAAGVCTALAFVAAVLLVLPLVIVLYLRRGTLITFIRGLQETVTVSVAGMTYTIELATLSDRAIAALSNLGLSIARAAPALAFKLILFVLLVYTLLLQPNEIGRTLRQPVPREYHDVVMSLHERTRAALYAIYVLQAATAAGTFFIALLFFWLLGYEATFSLAVICGILQFIPVLGPSVVILALASVEVLAGNAATAAVLTILGLFFVGFLPDAVIRPQLASLTGGMSASLYFIGFTGGVLSVGVIGVIAGPVLVALIAEAGELLAEDRHAASILD